ncbi:MAG TPA: alpha/beta fold hydrolase [Marmoricola sp.]|nr:alpha/beta fold hydrolase [Marmoricola sp.]
MPVLPEAEHFSSAGEPDASGRTVGVLLSHGFTGSPASMRPWGEALAERGYAVSVPRLPGHGTSWQELATTTYDDWYAEIERAHAELAARSDVVVVGGLSMGGTLALDLAAHHRDIAGLVLVNPAVGSTNRQLLALPALKHVIKSMPGIGNDIKKPGVTESGYDRTPLRALHTLVQAWKKVRTQLPDVTCPLLLFRSAEDHVVDPSSARIILGGVSSRDVDEVVLANSYHVATLDNDAPRIFQESAAFIQRVTAR